LHPARYAVAGAIILRDGNQEEFYHLFLPFGHFKVGDEYWIADFSELRAELKSTGDAVLSRCLDPQPQN
jgi:hypothetical protein